MGLMTGKKCLITGVANHRSIAWASARALHREGAELAFSYASERMKENGDELVATLGPLDSFPSYICNVSNDDEIQSMYDGLQAKWGKLDFLLHSIGYANTTDLNGRAHEVSRSGFAQAMEISAYSLVALAKGARPLMEAAGGGSIVSLTYLASERVVEKYTVMAWAKSALENETRYLAADLGPSNIRVNAISAGPLKTLAASAVKGISSIRDMMEERSPLRRNITADEVGNVAMFLASGLASAITGEIIYVDNGFHVLGV